MGTVQHIKDGKIKVKKDIEAFHSQGVIFEDGTRQDFDAVILATGYRAKVEDFLENVNGLLDKYEVPKQAVGEGEFKGLYFVGFDNYKLGGILGTIFTDSEVIVNTL